MPTKTVIFTGFQKFSGSGFRTLHSHEYTQMAGRAGRRGLDTVGYVFHLNNIMENPLASEYKMMLSGKPQTLTSKFSIEYNLLLNIIATQPDKTAKISDLVAFATRSMMNDEIRKSYKKPKKNIKNLKLPRKINFCNNLVLLPNMKILKVICRKNI